MGRDNNSETRRPLCLQRLIKFSPGISSSFSRVPNTSCLWQIDLWREAPRGEHPYQVPQPPWCEGAVNLFWFYVCSLPLEFVNTSVHTTNLNGLIFSICMQHECHLSVVKTAQSYKKVFTVTACWHKYYANCLMYFFTAGDPQRVGPLVAVTCSYVHLCCCFHSSVGPHEVSFKISSHCTCHFQGDGSPTPTASPYGKIRLRQLTFCHFGFCSCVSWAAGLCSCSISSPLCMLHCLHTSENSN